MNEWEWNLLEDKATLDHVEIGGVVVRRGDRVRLRPKEGGDILDIALRGQIATIESIEEDYENSQHICVVLDDDPGRDLGMMRQPGHRFFFTPAEVEPLPGEAATSAAFNLPSSTRKPTILVAGIGNIFLGDDGFGVEVVRRMLASAPARRRAYCRFRYSRLRSLLRNTGWIRHHNPGGCLPAWTEAWNRHRH